MELLYRYLQGPQFRQRISATVEVYSEMKEDMETGKAYMERRWAKRDKVIERAVKGVSGMYGDMQGILGMSMPELEDIEQKAIAPAVPEDLDESEK